MRKVKVAATQMSCSGSIDENIAKADKLVREVAAQERRLFCCKSCSRRRISARRKNRITMNMRLNWSRTKP